MRVNCGKRAWENWAETAPPTRECQVQSLVMRLPTLASSERVFQDSLRVARLHTYRFPRICWTPYSPGEAKHKILDELSATRKLCQRLTVPLPTVVVTGPRSGLIRKRTHYWI